MRLTKGFFAVLTCVLISGCAAHVPMSEAIIFNNEKNQELKGVGLILAGGPGKEITKKYVQRFNAEYSYRNDLAINQHRLRLAFFKTYYPSDRISFSVQVGIFVAGLDLTYRLTQRSFLTASISIPGKQAFIHNKLIDHKEIGLSLGVGARDEYYTFHSFGGQLVETNKVYSFGGRLNFKHREVEGEVRSNVGVNLYLGYMPAIKEPILEVALIVGNY